MKIAYFTNTYPRATDTFIRLEVLGLRKRGIEVNTYSVRKSGDDHNVDNEVISEKKNTSFILPFNILELCLALLQFLLTKPKNFLSSLNATIKTARPGIKGKFLQLAYFLEALVLAKRLKQDNIEHLHNHLGDNSGTVTLIASKLIGIPYSISIHGPHIFFDGLNWALNEKTKHSKFISCIGHFCKSQMMLYTESKYWDKFEIIRCGVDLEKYQYRNDSSAPSKLLFVGRLSNEKGLNVLLDSLAILKSENTDFTLTVLGDGPSRDNLEHQCKKLGLNNNVIFKGFVDQSTIREDLNNSDIFILPSFAEGIPVSLMEAMAIGVPVITTYVGGISELVIDNETGLLCYPSDSKGLADSIRKYLSDQKLVNSIAKSGRLHIETEFDVNKQIDKLAELFKK
jgi:colanic acid/amylovoran biosynthesis glycosyltransferase